MADNGIVGNNMTSMTSLTYFLQFPLDGASVQTENGGLTVSAYTLFTWIILKIFLVSVR